MIVKIKIAFLAALLILLGTGVYINKNTTSTGKPRTTQASAKPTIINYCAGATDSKSVIVSISKRHMWACEGSSTVYAAAVVTGYEGYPETLTPTGSYKIAAKQTNQQLVGSDRLGSWNVHVDFWLPFLTNKYGNYGFHDATWRAGSAFGNIDASSKDASHGCVELPLKAMNWLYDWADISTSVTVQS